MSMRLERALYQELSSIAKVFPLRASDNIGKEPFIVYTRVSTVWHPCFDTDAKVRTARIQVDCYATSYDKALEMADDVVERVQNAFGLGEGGGKVEVGVNMQDKAHDYEENTKRYRVRLAVIISYHE